MNILFFLSPKQDLMYVYDDFTLRQTLEKWENNRYASIPVLNRKGEYVGTLTEGDILWGLKKYHGLDLEAAEDIPISEFAHKRDYKAVTVTTSMDELVEAVAKAKACEGKPTLIWCKTVKGKGVSFMENQVGWHGGAINDEQYETAMKELKG